MFSICFLDGISGESSWCGSSTFFRNKAQNISIYILSYTLHRCQKWCIKIQHFELLLSHFIWLFVYLFSSLEHGGQLFRNEKRAAVTWCSLEKDTSGMPTIAYRIIENQRNAGNSNKVCVLKIMFKITNTTKLIIFFLTSDLNQVCWKR